MSDVEIEESGMIFKFPEEDLFHIEKCSTVKAIRKGVKTIEMVVKQNQKLIFIEAKQSSPQPGNTERFDEFMQEIYEKFRNSLILFSGIALKRPFKKNTQFPKNLTAKAIANSSIHFYLIIKGHKEEWLSPLSDELNSSLNAVKKCFAIKDIKVLNDAMARQYKLIL